MYTEQSKMLAPHCKSMMLRGGPAMNRVGLAANEYKSGELESVKFLPQTANSYVIINIRFDE